MFIPSSGTVSFSNIRNVLGRSSNIPVALSDLYNVHPLTPVGGQIALTNVRGITTQGALFQSFRPDVQASTLGLYSVRQVNSSYTGAVMNIRRSSDNSTLDFHADYSGNLKASDGTAYGSWSNGTMSVMTWYDQSGGNRHTGSTTASGGNPPILVLDPVGTGKYVIHFPNGSASASAYYGFTMTGQNVASMMCTYHSLVNTSGFQSLLCTVTDNQGVRLTSNQIVTGDVNDFLNPGGFAVYDGSYSNTSPFVTNVDGVWHTICASRASGTLSMIHIGHCDVTFSGGTIVNRSFNGYMTDMYTFNTSLPTITQAIGTTNPDYQVLFKRSHIPFWRNGLIGCYTAETWNGTQWRDQSTASNHATTYTGTITSTNTSAL